MSSEEKILAILEEHSRMFGQVFSRMDQIQAEQKQMRDEQNQMRAEQKQMRDEQSQLRSEITSIKLRLELDIEKRFDAVNEGIDTILKTMAPKSRIDALEDEMAFMKAAFKAMSQRIAELEKAQ